MFFGFNFGLRLNAQLIKPYTLDGEFGPIKFEQLTRFKGSTESPSVIYASQLASSALKPSLFFKTLELSIFTSAKPMPPNLCFLFLLITISTIASRAGAIGVNWGTTSSHPLPPSKVVELLKSNKITKVKLFDADPLVLQALSGSNIGVTVGIPNSMLKSLNSSKKAAESWVHDNVTRYISSSGRTVRIEYALF